MKFSNIFSFLFITLSWVNATASDDGHTANIPTRSVSNCHSSKLSTIATLDDCIRNRYSEPGEESRRKEYLMSTITKYRKEIGDNRVIQEDTSIDKLEDFAIAALHNLRHAKGIDLMSEYSVTNPSSIASTKVSEWIEGVGGSSPSPRIARNTTDNDEQQTVSATTLLRVDQDNESERMPKNNPLKLEKSESKGKGWWATTSQVYGTVRGYVQQYPELTIVTVAAAGVIFGRKTAHPLQITPLDVMYLFFSEL